MAYRQNGVEIDLLRTLQFTVEADRDPAAIDTLWFKYTVRVTGFVRNYYTGQDEFQQDSAAVIAQIKARLETPRRGVLYQIGDTKLVNLLEGNGVDALDCKLGPECLPATVTQPIANGPFQVECGFVTYLRSCVPGATDSTPSDPVVSLRWTQSETFDENWTSSVHTSGRLICRSDLRQSADKFRTRIPVPTPANGYQRVAQKFTLSSSGYELDFEFTDRQADRLPPRPATTAQGTFSVEVQEPGICRVGVAAITLAGPPGTSRADLMLLAMKMAYSKMNREGSLTTRNAPMIYGRMEEDLFQPRVSVNMSCRLRPLNKPKKDPPPGAEFGPLAIAVGNPVPDTIPADSRTAGPVGFTSVGTWPDYVERNGPSIIMPVRIELPALIALGFVDPCSGGSSSGPSPASPGSSIWGILSGTGTPTIDPTTVTVSPFESLPTVPLDDATTDVVPHSVWWAKKVFTIDTGKVMMAGTGVGASGAVASVVRQSAGFMKMVMSWAVARTGQPPEPPSTDLGDDNLVFLGGTLAVGEAMPPVDGGDGIQQTITGEYVYGVLDPAKVTMVGVVPPEFATDRTLAAAQEAARYWLSPFAQKGVTGSNPLVPGGAYIGESPVIDAPPETPPDITPPPDQGGGGEDGGASTPPVNP